MAWGSPRASRLTSAASPWSDRQDARRAEATMRLERVDGFLRMLRVRHRPDQIENIHVPVPARDIGDPRDQTLKMQSDRVRIVRGGGGRVVDWKRRARLEPGVRFDLRSFHAARYPSAR